MVPPKGGKGGLGRGGWGGGVGPTKLIDEGQQDRDSAKAVQDVPQLAGAAELGAFQDGSGAVVISAALVHLRGVVQHPPSCRLR